MRVSKMSIAIGVVTMLFGFAAPEAAAQGRVGVLRSPPRPSLGGGARPRGGTIGPQFFNSCVFAPSAFSFFGGLPFINIQVFASSQSAPNPASHIVPDPSGQPVPMPGSHPLPNVQPAPGSSPIPGANTVSAHAVPVYSAPVYSAPVYTGAAPIATPQVTNGMVVGDIIDDPTFGFWGDMFFGGGGFVCGPTRLIRGII